MKTTLFLTSVVLVLASCSKQEPVEPNSASTETTTKPYPLKICLVSGEKLGSMGEPTSLIHEGQEIKFCCDSCEPRFKKDPAKYLSKLENP